MRLASRLAAAASGLLGEHERVLVGVDGPDAAGKTTLADALADAVDGPVLRASIDDFHQPHEVRRRRGGLSAEGYYRDAFDYLALRGECLIPFRDGASKARTAKYDLRAESACDARAVEIPRRAVLVVDGVFLLREQLRDMWTLSVYLRLSPEETLRRATRRDLELFGSSEEIERRYHARYLPGQELYRAEADPEAAAHVVVDNERPDAPRIVRSARPL
ncbi:MAG: uridine kinase [Stackebrandtia sp.]